MTITLYTNKNIIYQKFDITEYDITYYDLLKYISYKKDLQKNNYD
jgi:hypothetical protein